MRADMPGSSNSPKLLILMGLLWLVLAAALLFYQFSNPATVQVTWETATELQTAGFQLYRSTAPDGEFMRISSGLIPSQGSAVSGASYTYIDKNVVPGETYYYVLEEVEYDATTNRYDEEMFAYQVPQVMWWAVVLTAASVLAGLALLVTGLREDRTL